MSATDLSMAMPMSAAAPKGRILCVDDEPNLLRALSWLLQKEFEVMTAANGHEALEMVRRHDFDVVISDQRMPEMSGVDLLRQVRVAAPRAMRILLTGYSDLDAVLRSVNESEIFRYVTKPWDVNELPRIVAQAAHIARSQRDLPLSLEHSAATPADNAKILMLHDDIQVHTAVELCAGDLAPVVHVANIADAIHHLQEGGIGVIIAETSFGSVDLTRLICFLKQHHPQVVSIVLGDDTGTDTVMKLVNQGQVFRFVPKPIKAALMRDTLRAALGRNSEIRRCPELGRRYVVDQLPEDELCTLRTDLDAAAHARNMAKAEAQSSTGGRMGGLLRRFFANEGSHA